MELLSGHEKIITKSGILLNAGTLNQGLTVFMLQYHIEHFYVWLKTEMRIFSYLQI